MMMTMKELRMAERRNILEYFDRGVRVEALRRWNNVAS